MATNKKKDSNHLSLRNDLSKLSRRTQKILHNEAQFEADGIRAAPQALSFDAYLQPYAKKVRESVNAGRCCLLMGVLGTGKTAVLLQVKVPF